MPDLDDLRGMSLAAIHAVTNAAMIVGVPVLFGRRLAARRSIVTSRAPLATIAAAVVIGTGLTVMTRRAAWTLVRLWLRMDDPAGPRRPPGGPSRAQSSRVQASGR